jgi:hypothetical protein
LNIGVLKEPVMFKIQKQEDNGIWRDVRNAGVPLLFGTKAEAQSKLAELFPVLVGMEKYGGADRTRVIAILEDESEDEGWPKRSG